MFGNSPNGRGVAYGRSSPINSGSPKGQEGKKVKEKSAKRHTKKQNAGEQLPPRKLKKPFIIKKQSEEQVVFG